MVRRRGVGLPAPSRVSAATTAAHAASSCPGGPAAPSVPASAINAPLVGAKTVRVAARSASTGSRSSSYRTAARARAKREREGVAATRSASVPLAHGRAGRGGDAAAHTVGAARAGMAKTGGGVATPAGTATAAVAAVRVTARPARSTLSHGGYTDGGNGRRAVKRQRRGEGGPRKRERMRRRDRGGEGRHRRTTSREVERRAGPGRRGADSMADHACAVPVQCRASDGCSPAGTARLICSTPLRRRPRPHPRQRCGSPAHRCALRPSAHPPPRPLLNPPPRAAFPHDHGQQAGGS